MTKISLSELTMRLSLNEKFCLIAADFDFARNWSNELVRTRGRTRGANSRRKFCALTFFFESKNEFELSLPEMFQRLALDCGSQYEYGQNKKTHHSNFSK